MSFRFYLNHLAVSKGFSSYEEWYDWVCRENQIPTVVAQQIESMYKEAFDMCLTDLQIENYSGHGIEFIDNRIKHLKNQL